MSSVTRIVRTSEEIRDEIEETLGFLAPFFEPALPTPPVLESLWQQTLAAYIDSPLPAFFKERLNALLSRFCAVPYCMVVHSSALRPLGMTAREVLALLETPPPVDTDLDRRLAVLDAHPVTLADFPAPDSPPEQALLACATALFLEDREAGRCQEGLALALGPDLFNSLTLFLSYIKTCHAWVMAHPEIVYEADRRAQDNLGPLLAEEPALADFFRDYQGKMRAQRLSRGERDAADEALRRAQAQTIRVLESITDGFLVLDAEWRFTYLNPQAETLLQRPRGDLLGKNAWAEFPDAVGTMFERENRRAMAEQVAVTFEAHYPPPLDAWFEAKVYPSRDGLSIYFHDVTERRRVQDALGETMQALRENEMLLRDARARLESALSAGETATWTWDVTTDRVLADPKLARLFSVSAADAAGGPLAAYLRAIHPDDQGRVARAIGDAVAREETYDVEYRVVLPDGADRWLMARGRVTRDAEGRAVALDGVVADIHERVARQRRERFLSGLAERTRALSDPAEVVADAVRSLGLFLGLSRCSFADIDPQADTCTVPVDYCAAPSVASQVGSFPLSAFGAFVVAEFSAGRTVVVDDTSRDSLRVPPETLPAYEALGIRAHVTVPIVHSARQVSVISCHSAAPRRWTAEEVTLIQAAAERTWLTVEVIRQERALARAAEERQEALARTGDILETIATAFYSVDADFRFSYVNGQAEARWGMQREDLLGRSFLEVFPKMAGTEPFSRHEQVMAGGDPTHYETLSPILGSWVEVSIYPTAGGGLSVFFSDISDRKALEGERERLADANRLLLESTGDGIYGIDTQGRFTFVNRSAERMLGFTRDELLGRHGHWLIHHTRPDGTLYPEDECPIYHALRDGGGVHVEDDAFWRADGTSFPVAYTAAPILEDGVVRGGVVTFADISERRALEAERERLAERERNIARQLQTALLPELPAVVPGLAVTKHYEAALAEAGVGGDFWDVFSVGEGRTALVLGDLSGKGLAAAAQVATVRNMLRAFVYTRPSLADAVTDLNGVLAENGLLTGFTTLFVAVYRAGERTLTYVNCGQEPTLVRRAGGGVEELPPTGPVLGPFEGAAFEERVVALAPGDAVAIFTDGLTEVGRSRRQMLGVEGVADLLARPLAAECESAPAVADHLCRRLIVGVDAAAAGGLMRDDVCLLVGVIT